jgi:hypothetical protein
MSNLKILLPVLIIMVLLTAVLSAQDTAQVPECFEELPPGISIKKSFFAPENTVDAIAKKFGAKIEKISNTIFDAYGGMVQINIVYAASDEDAEKFYKILLEVHKGDTDYCFRKGLRVFEFAKAGPMLVRRVTYELGLKDGDVELPSSICYRVTADLAMVEKAGYMSSNKLCNLLISAGKSDRNEEMLREIKEVSRRFKFGNYIMLRKPELGEIKYGFQPAAVKHEEVSGSTVRYFFEDSKECFGVPYVTVSMEISVNNEVYTPTDRKPDKQLVSATGFWPADDPGIIKLAEEIGGSWPTTEEKVKAILEWLKPGSNIEFGDRKGTRWGVKNVIEKRRGRCEDFADLFITMCRALDVPCRLVGGWIYKVSGHAWAEVLIEGKGWRQVDPSSGGMMSCDVYYIPYFTTETGDMPLVYASNPEIEILKRED